MITENTPLTQAIVHGADRTHVLKRVRLGEILVTTDLEAFRAPFGKNWHSVGAGHAAPEHIPLTGAVEGADLTDSKLLLAALLDDLPAAHLLSIGAWDLPVVGNTGAVSVTPTLAGWQIQFTLIRAEET